MTSPVHLDTGARALGALPPDERAAFDAHLDGCDSCAGELAEFRQTTALLAAAVAVRPPDSLRDSVMRAVAMTPQLPPVTLPAAADAERPGDPVVAGHWTRGQWYRRPWTVVAAAVIAAAIAAGALIATRPGAPGPAEAAQQCVQLAPDAEVMRPTVGSGGSVTLSMSCGAAVVRLAAMPDLPSGMGYQLWVMAGDRARSAGMMPGRDTAAHTFTLTDVTAADTGIGISVEPVSGSKAPTTGPVWMVPLSG
jgi:anti-sigma factor RsiW